MRKLLIGLIALTSLSTLASETTKKCNVYQLVSDAGYSRYEKIDTLDLGTNSSEFGRPVKGLDNIGLKIRSAGNGAMNVFLVEGHNFSIPSEVIIDMNANISQRPLDIRLAVKGEMLSLNCGMLK